MAGTVNDVEERRGDCETCGRWSSKLLHAMCPWCREKYEKPRSRSVSLIRKLWRRKL